MRAPSTGAPAADLYEAALDMVTFAEENGCTRALVCEHHGIDDGYLPSPMTLATAMAVRTKTMPIMIGAVILPLYDPLRLAEDMNVLDIISKGRVSYVCAVGARKSEYELLGVDFHTRGKSADKKLDTLLKAKTGEAFELDGRTVRITPGPYTPGGPMIMWGGGTPAAARRAGRNGLMFFGQGDDPAIAEAYAAARSEAGYDAGFCYAPGRNDPMSTFVAEDVDQAWEDLGPYLMHDVLQYGEWYADNPDISSTSFAKTAEELRAQNTSHRIFSVDEAVEWVRAGKGLALHPLIGGLPPELAWKYLRVVTDQVVPAVKG